MPALIRRDPGHPLNSEQRSLLRCLVGLIIPASERHGVPGADDELIFADILETLRSQADRVAETLAALQALADGPLDSLPREQQVALGQILRKNRPPGLMAIVNAVGQCYYRDDRVMRSLEMEARAPFPKGFELEQGDWSLLDPVRGRAPFYRRVP